ncbi:MAG: 3-deoxy-D-manno-octulosonic acid transferase [Proteobacteria bacterium]|nr:MAG: 3-deoxy-D-manno-octulosonic acid transferase [Pseudomonadota bacterium]
MALALALYRGLTGPAAPLLIARDAARLRRAGLAPDRIAERRGKASLARPAGAPLIWINAVSMGESLSVQPVIAALCAAGAHVLLTTTTATAAQMAGDRLPEGAWHQFAPLDLPGPVTRFLDHWRPDAAVFVESDLWPRQILAAQARGIPLALINARLSQGSLRGWSAAPRSARRIFSAFDLVRVQTASTASALKRLGAPRAAITGDLKAVAAQPPVDPAAHAALSAAIGTRPLWLAASTHPGEEEACATAHPTLPDEALLILAPRHPERGPEIAAQLSAQGWRTALRSTGALPDASTQIYIADTLGELGLFYSLAPLAFIGGSLVALGGHNPYEAAHFGTALLTGPNRSSFKAPYDALIEAGACVSVPDAAALPAALRAALAPEALATMRAAHAGLPKPDPDLPQQIASDIMALSRR